MENRRANELIRELEKYRGKKPKDANRAALAELRSGRGKMPGEAPRMFPYIVKILDDGQTEGPFVTAAFLTASNFAFHHEPGGSGNLGESLRKSISKKHNEAGVEARLVAALDANPEILPRHLDGLVSLCESANVPIDWRNFLVDVESLLSPYEHVRNRVRMQWAKGFWGASQVEQNDSNEEPNQEEQESQ